MLSIWLPSLITLALANTPQALTRDVSPYLDHMEVFTDGQGHYLAFFNRWKSGWNRFFWGTQHHMFQLFVERDLKDDQGGFHAFEDSRIQEASKRAIRFADPNDFSRVQIVCGPKITPITPVSRKVDFSKTVFHPLSQEVRVPQYIVEIGKGTFVYVDAPRYGGGSDDWRLYYGTPGAMNEAKIVHARGMLDGGSYSIKDEHGRRLELPVRGTPSWQAVAGSLRDKATFDVGSLGIPQPEVEVLPTPCDGLFEQGRIGSVKKETGAQSSK